MAITFSMGLNKIIAEFSLVEVNMPAPPENILITNNDINRPGLHLAGYYDFFDPTRVQILGNTEFGYIESLSEVKRRNRIFEYFSHKPVAVVVTRELEPTNDMIEAAVQYEIPLLKTPETTSFFLSGLISRLNVELAPRVTRHGVLIEVYGEGILLVGESGVGKSETAVELIKRGHRLIADDAVEIRRVSSKTLVGSAPANIRHYIELRGIGIINARRIFGMGSVKLTEKIDIVLNLELWDKNKVYDRMGMEEEYTELLGLNVPSLTIPVKPGRNLAVIIEVAAMNNRQKKMGYNSAAELLAKLGMLEEDIPAVDTEYDGY